MKQLVALILVCISAFSFAQEKEELLALKKANNHVYKANTLINGDDFVSAEMEYRKAISKQPNSVAGMYNLGNSYYNKENYEAALYRHQQAAKSATSKEEKHKAFHNIGNTLMKNKNYKEAIEAYKDALRNNSTDEETRYNLALAKKKQKEEEKKQDQNKDDKKDDKDKKDENKDNKDKKDDKENNDKEKDNKEGDDKEDKKDKGDEEKKEDDKKDKPKDKKDDKGKGDEKEKQQPKPQPGQLSPQQIKSLLEAMNNQEQKVQEKMNAEKQKGVKVKTEKDW
ncbi:aerotolerance regulator BatC [Flavivirga aquatica]|uniref:Aerotolerance regulator BatC n=1 Tax=Flavivirga aquatica TaxID=1849968 RepID=A0A1E5TDW3_9FLAO|nr:tetratricopeptide repeat protein [Flavivirga aquatica]OEK09541.1 aerotolerance regulator BatC [Flavivirga aquatica]